MLVSVFAEWTGLEPATSCVTGRHSNRLNYHSERLFDTTKLESNIYLYNTLHEKIVIFLRKPLKTA